MRAPTCLPAGALLRSNEKGDIQARPPSCQDRGKKPDEISRESLNMDSISYSPDVNPACFIYS